MVRGNFPFHTKEEICNEHVDIDFNIKPKTQDIIRRCLQKCPEKRPTLIELLADPFFMKKSTGSSLDSSLNKSLDSSLNNSLDSSLDSALGSSLDNSLDSSLDNVCQNPTEESVEKNKSSREKRKCQNTPIQTESDSNFDAKRKKLEARFLK